MRLTVHDRLARRRSRPWDEHCTRPTVRRCHRILRHRVPGPVRRRVIEERRRGYPRANGSRDQRPPCPANDPIRRTRLPRRRISPYRLQQLQRAQELAFTRPAINAPHPSLVPNDSHCTRLGRDSQGQWGAMGASSRRLPTGRRRRRTWPRWSCRTQP